MFFCAVCGWSLVFSFSLLPFSHLPDMVGGLGASSVMLSPVVQTVLQMGFEASLVESLVQTKYLLTGQHYTSVSDLVTDVLQAEQEDRQRGPQSRGNSQRWKVTLYSSMAHKYSSVVLVLYLRISIFCYFTLLLHYSSEGNYCTFDSIFI